MISSAFKFQAPKTKDSFFISFEGIEGAGKTTQIKLLEEHLKNMGFNLLLTREPGGSVFGDKLREAILSSKTKIHPIAEAHLFASARAQHLVEVILPHLAQTKSIVLCDRFIDSSLAYQGVARNLGIETILNIHQHPPLNIVPHLTFYLSINLNTSYERQKKRGASKDYFESQKKHFYEKLIEGFDELNNHFRDRFIKIDANKTEGEVFEQIKNHIGKLING